jgi:hypothetical protein
LCDSRKQASPTKCGKNIVVACWANDIEVAVWKRPATRCGSYYDLRRKTIRGRWPIEDRKRKLAKLVRGPHPGIVLNEFFEGDGDILFAHACKLGCEGIVSKRFGSSYRSGRSAHWVKVKNPKAPAVKREAEEDWKRWEQVSLSFAAA